LGGKGEYASLALEEWTPLTVCYHDRRIPNHYIDPAPHTMQTVPITGRTC